MNLALCHGLSKSKELVGFRENKSVILAYLVPRRSDASNIPKRKQKISKSTKTEHACVELNPTKQMSGPWCPLQSTKQCSEK